MLEEISEEELKDLEPIEERNEEVMTEGVSKLYYKLCKKKTRIDSIFAQVTS